jgi:putative transposase
VGAQGAEEAALVELAIVREKRGQRKYLFEHEEFRHAQKNNSYCRASTLHARLPHLDSALAMPRRPRLELPGVPLHVIHRGVNRAATFLDDEDFIRYRHCLSDALAEQGIPLHAYVLMTNHVHLLLTPAAPGRLSAAMRTLGQRYVPAFNRKHRRTGTLWEGRFKSCLVDSERYLVTVHRYIELNPVRAAMVAQPEDYRWSSVHASLGTALDPAITPHDTYLALAPDPAQRGALYSQWLRQGINEEDLNAVRAHLQQERALGNPQFQAMMEKTLNRAVAVRPRGRPRKTCV